MGGSDIQWTGMEDVVLMIKLSDLVNSTQSTSTLSSLYLLNNQIDTTSGRNFIIAGAGALEVTATGGLKLGTSFPVVPGQVWTALDAYGDGYWQYNPTSGLTPATASTPGTITKEFIAPEQTIPTTLSWNDGYAPTGLSYSKYIWVKVSNRVDAWFYVEYSTPNALRSSGVTFQLPGDMPQPFTSPSLSDGDTITHGVGKVFTSSLGAEVANQTSEVSLYKISGTYTISIVTLNHQKIFYGPNLPNPTNPIGFNAHITYYTNL